jgi:hypothetical protein
MIEEKRIKEIEDTPILVTDFTFAYPLKNGELVKVQWLGMPNDEIGIEDMELFFRFLNIHRRIIKENIKKKTMGVK